MAMSVRRRTSIRSLVALGLGVGLFAGCTTNDGKEPEPSASTTDVTTAPEPTPSESPAAPYDGTVAPQMPADMANDGYLGARAAATYLFEARHWGLVSNDGTVLEEICDPKSAFCTSSIDAIAENAKIGAVVQGGRSAFTIGSVLPPTPESAFFEVLGTIEEQPMTKSSATGEVLFTTDGQDDVPFVVFAEFLPGDGWIIRGADVDTR